MSQRRASTNKQDTVKVTRSSKNTPTDQPNIKEALETAATETMATSPATTADINKVLEKLETIQSDNVSIKKQLGEIQTKLQTKIDAVEAKVTELSDKNERAIQDNRSAIKTIQSTVEDMEKSLNFQCDKLDTQKDELVELLKKQEEKFDLKLKEFEKRETALKKDLQNMSDKNLDMERHIRKYNLLIYGIPEGNRENVYITIKDFLKNDAKLPEETVDQMIFQNAHRLPTKGSGPKPIIVRFVRWSDREMVLSQVYKGVLPKGKNILSDLPPPLKAERHRLMQEAYKLRNGTEKYKTRVFERGNTLQLQTRKSATDPWKNFKV